MHSREVPYAATDIHTPTSCITTIRLLSRIWIQWLIRIIPHRLHNPQPHRPPLPKQNPLPHSQILGPLHEPKRHRRPIPRADKRPIDIDNRARLADRPHVQHGLVFRLDGRRVAEYEHLGDEFAVDFWGRVVGVQFGEHDHAFADFFSADPFEGERGGLAGGADGDGDAFAFDGADACGGELAEGVGADEDGVTRVDYS